MKPAPAIGILASLALVLSASGQTRVIPQSHAWVTQQAPAHDSPEFVPIVVVWVHTYRPEWGGGYYCLHDPDLAAKDAAYTLRDANWISGQGQNVMIMIPHIGHEYPTLGFPCYTWPSEDDRAFFRVADALSGYEDPHPDHHPFLVNATTGSFIRQWVIDFREGLKDWIEELELDLDPNTFQFGMDTETLVCDEGVNSLKMLNFLASNSTIWNTWKVPGSAGWQPAASHATNTTGQTLAQMYAEMVTATAGGADPWPEDILDTTRGLLPTATDGHENDRNRRYMMWFWSICERAREAVMQASFYSVINDPVDGWPEAVCSNYHAANYDDLDAPTPVPKSTDTWFADKQFWSNSLFPDDVDAWDPTVNPQHYTQLPARTCLSPSQSARLWEPSSNDERWVSRRRMSLCPLDSPELYQLSDHQWGGREEWGQRGHWSLDPYVPVGDQHPALAEYPLAGYLTAWGNWTPLKETKAQSRMRIARHTVESIINSGDGGHEVRMAPWTTMYFSSAAGTSEYRSAEREYRMILATLRGKNVPFLKFWPDTRGLSQLSETLQIDAFMSTRDVVRRVWATEVRSVQAVLGATYTPWPLPQNYPTPAEMLEYTLRNAEHEDVVYPLVATDEPPTVAAIEVVVKIPADYRLVYDFEINLEALAPAGVTGRLRARSAINNQYTDVPTMEGTTEYAADTNAEFAALSPEVMRPIRRTFWLEQDTVNPSGNHQFVHAPTLTHDYPHLVLRFYHDHHGDSTESRFDLVQVVPIPMVSNSVMDPKDALAIADLNADECIDETDLDLFTDGYFNQNAIADMNMDEAWDEVDVGIFLSAYCNP